MSTYTANRKFDNFNLIKALSNATQETLLKPNIQITHVAYSPSTSSSFMIQILISQMIARCIAPKQLPNYQANCNLKLTKQFLVSKQNFGRATPRLMLLTSRQVKVVNLLQALQPTTFYQTTAMDGTRTVPRFLSRVRVNWLSAGGTLRRCLRMRRWRWMRTTLGHLTKRWRSFLGGRAPPIPNCFGLFSNSGFVTTCANQTHKQFKLSTK